MTTLLWTAVAKTTRITYLEAWSLKTTRLYLLGAIFSRQEGSKLIKHPEDYLLPRQPYPCPTVYQQPGRGVYGVDLGGIHQGDQGKPEVDVNIIAQFLFIRSGAAPFPHLGEDEEGGGAVSVCSY